MGIGGIGPGDSWGRPLSRATTELSKAVAPTSLPMPVIGSSNLGGRRQSAGRSNLLAHIATTRTRGSWPLAHEEKHPSALRRIIVIPCWTAVLPICSPERGILWSSVTTRVLYSKERFVGAKKCGDASAGAEKLHEVLGVVQGGGGTPREGGGSQMLVCCWAPPSGTW